MRPRSIVSVLLVLLGAVVLSAHPAGSVHWCEAAAAAATLADASTCFSTGVKIGEGGERGNGKRGR